MGVHVHIDGLDEELAAAVVERILDELPDRLAGALQQDQPEPPDAGEAILGVRPYKLYPVAWVAERWEVSKDYVRKMPGEDLPRAPWHGGEIRYRGLDILRYEGVDVEHLLPANVHALQSTEEHTSPRSSAPSDRSPSRPYQKSLPPL